MFCPKCGAGVPDGSRYCKECGAEMPIPVQTEPAPSTPSEVVASKPAGGLNKKLIGIIVAAVVVVAIVIVLALSLMSPKQFKGSAILTYPNGSFSLMATDENVTVNAGSYTFVSGSIESVKKNDGGLVYEVGNPTSSWLSDYWGDCTIESASIMIPKGASKGKVDGTWAVTIRYTGDYSGGSLPRVVTIWADAEKDSVQYAMIQEFSGDLVANERADAFSENFTPGEYYVETATYDESDDEGYMFTSPYGGTAYLFFSK